MVTIEDFTKFKYLDYGKVFLVLYFKGFSWKKELQNEFNISNSIVTKALQILEENGYIIAKDFWSLDLDSQEAIKRLNAGYSYLIQRHPKIYTLSVEGREEGGYVILEELKKKAKVHSSLQATIEFVKNKTKAYNLLKKEFEKEEDSLFSRRRIDHTTGIMYETPTKRRKKFLAELKEAFLELKKEKLLIMEDRKELTNNRKKDLILANNELVKIDYEIKYKKRDFNRIKYNGKDISNRDSVEIENKINENIDKEPVVLGKDLSEIEKEHANLFNEFKEQLGIDVDTITKQSKKDEELCLQIIDNIKDKGWMDIFAVQRTCGSPKIFRQFLKLAEKNNIVDDGEDFRFIPS